MTTHFRTSSTHACVLREGALVHSPTMTSTLQIGGLTCCRPIDHTDLGNQNASKEVLLMELKLLNVSYLVHQNFDLHFPSNSNSPLDPSDKPTDSNDYGRYLVSHTVRAWPGSCLARIESSELPRRGYIVLYSPRLKLGNSKPS